MRATVFPGEDPLTLDTPEQAAEFIVPMCLPSWSETGKLYDYTTRTLMSFPRRRRRDEHCISEPLTRQPPRSGDRRIRGTRSDHAAAAYWIARFRGR